ncbi:MAG: hypothetical protein DHS20C11_16220 [Lysobacteraceae bacterium]|nr:MAG: hypothetical protein DHS20C11_16220 [Xanthomonadaceae bacterium]
MSFRPIIFALSLIAGCNAQQPAPDLLIASRPVLQLGRSIDCAHMDHFQISNLGTATAYAMVLHPVFSSQSLQAIRVQPGPAAGQSVMATVCWPPEAQGERCVEARLQRLAENDAPDPNPDNNQWCSTQ